ncbi:hypothetical protein D3C78_1763580 [compost metagenome]
MNNEIKRCTFAGISQHSTAQQYSKAKHSSTESLDLEVWIKEEDAECTYVYVSTESLD